MYSDTKSHCAKVSKLQGFSQVSDYDNAKQLCRILLQEFKIFEIGSAVKNHN